MQLREVSNVYPRNASGGQDTFDLMTDFSLENAVIVAMTLVFRATMTATGGGAISGFHRDAPCGLMTNAKLAGGYEGGLRQNRRTIFDMPPQQMFYPGVYETGVFNALLRTSSGAAQTDPVRATIPVPLVDRLADTARMTYIDPRDYTSLNLEVRWAPDTDLASTNLSTVQAVECEVFLTILENFWKRGTPHYEPNLVYKELSADTASSRLTDNGAINWDGDLWSLWFQQFDESASGDSERVDGLVRALTVPGPKGDAIPWVRWDVLRRSTWAKYNYSLSTTEVAGVAAASFKGAPQRSHRGSLKVVRNTSETNPPGVTAITPTAGDLLMTTAIAAQPVYARQGQAKK